MKIYTRVVISPSGEVLEEDSYEYSGSLALCKGGQHRAQRESEKQAKRSYELQLQMFEFQKAQIAKLEANKTAEEAKEAAKKERQIASKRVGHRSTILTSSSGVSGPLPLSTRNRRDMLSGR